MKFFLYSKCGEGCGLAKRIQDEGNEIKVFIKDSGYRMVYEGILDKSNGTGYIDKDTVIVFDSSGMGNKADSLRDSGFMVFGASSFHDRLENDREFGLEFMENHGILIPKTEKFEDFSKGTDFIKKNAKKRFVFKPSGELPSKLTYSCSDSEDLILYMQFVENNYRKEIDDFVLQEFIEGAVVSTEYWVARDGFIDPMNHTVEVKKLMNNDLGPSTGCSGNVVWLGERGDPIDSEIRKVEEDLIRNNYLGPIDLNCIVSEKGVYGLEWTPRFGLDALPTYMQLLTGDISELIYEISSGGFPDPLVEDSFAGGIRVTIPPYPLEPEAAHEVQQVSPNLGIPIRGLDDDLKIYFYEVMMKNNQLYHSEGTGVIAVVSDIGDTPESSLEEPYRILEDCKIPDKQYRTDLGKVLPEMYKEVEESLKCLK